MFFGGMALLLVGASWCLVGVIMGQAPRKGVEPSLVQLGGGLVALLVGLGLLSMRGMAAVPLPVLLTACACYAADGAINCAMLQLMSYAMQRGPNGIIWSIIQSALIFSFLGGVGFFGVSLTWGRGVGIVLLTGAVSYPLMVGSCIVSFTIYSRLVLKERLKPLQYLALVLCLTGLAGLCLP